MPSNTNRNSARGRIQFRVGSGFDDATVLDYEDFVGVGNGGEAVGDDERGAVLKEASQRALDYPLGLGVNG